MPEGRGEGRYTLTLVDRYSTLLRDARTAAGRRTVADRTVADTVLLKVKSHSGLLMSDRADVLAEEWECSDETSW